MAFVTHGQQALGLIRSRPRHLTIARCALCQKFVCTTIRPSLLPYKELNHFEGAAAFLADFLAYEPLKVPTELVRAKATAPKAVGRPARERPALSGSPLFFAPLSPARSSAQDAAFAIYRSLAAARQLL